MKKYISKVSILHVAQNLVQHLRFRNKRCTELVEVFGMTIIFAITFVCFAFSSCNGVIFDEIRNEVKLADAKVSGPIQNIIRYQMDGHEYIFAAPGKIYYRCVDTTKDLAGNDVDDFAQSAANTKVSFGTFSKPSGHVYSIGADAEYLYAISSVIEDDDDGDNVPTNRVLWCYNTDSKEWESIWTGDYSSSLAATILSTNNPQNSNREAYFKLGSKLYKLEGSKSVLDDDENDNLTSFGYVYRTNSSYPVGNNLVALDEDNSTNLLSVNSCVNFNGTTYFSSAYAMTTNEDFTNNATYIYYSSSDNVLYSTDGSSWTAVDLNCDTIYSLAVTSDYLFVGTDEGVAHTTWASAGIPSAGNADFSKNAASTLSSYYEIPAVLAIDTSLSEYEGTIFASAKTASSSASLGNVGLWSYFKSTGEWNRE